MLQHHLSNVRFETIHLCLLYAEKLTNLVASPSALYFIFCAVERVAWPVPFTFHLGPIGSERCCFWYNLHCAFPTSCLRNHLVRFLRIRLPDHHSYSRPHSCHHLHCSLKMRSLPIRRICLSNLPLPFFTRCLALSRSTQSSELVLTLRTTSYYHRTTLYLVLLLNLTFAKLSH